MQVSFLTTRCQYQWEIAIVDQLDVSSNVKLPFLTLQDGSSSVYITIVDC